jgi:hypothetical protein
MQRYRQNNKNCYGQYFPRPPPLPLSHSTSSYSNSKKQKHKLKKRTSNPELGATRTRTVSGEYASVVLAIHHKDNETRGNIVVCLVEDRKDQQRNQQQTTSFTNAREEGCDKRTEAVNNDELTREVVKLPDNTSDKSRLSENNENVLIENEEYAEREDEIQKTVPAAFADVAAAQELTVLKTEEEYRRKNDCNDQYNMYNEATTAVVNIYDDSSRATFDAGRGYLSPSYANTTRIKQQRQARSNSTSINKFSMSNVPTSVSILFIWSISALAWIPTVLYFKSRDNDASSSHHEQQASQCTFETNSPIIVIPHSLIVYYLPIFLIIFFYSRCILIVNKKVVSKRIVFASTATDSKVNRDYSSNRLVKIKASRSNKRKRCFLVVWWAAFNEMIRSFLSTLRSHRRSSRNKKQTVRVSEELKGEIEQLQQCRVILANSNVRNGKSEQETSVSPKHKQQSTALISCEREEKEAGKEIIKNSDVVLNKNNISNSNATKNVEFYLGEIGDVLNNDMSLTYSLSNPPRGSTKRYALDVSKAANPNRCMSNNSPNPPVTCENVPSQSESSTNTASTTTNTATSTSLKSKNMKKKRKAKKIMARERVVTYKLGVILATFLVNNKYKIF